MPVNATATIQPNLSAALKHRMSHLIARQGIIASNVANAATPGYHAQDVSFKKLFSHNGIKVTQTNKKHLAGKGMAGGGKITSTKAGMTLNGNSVRLDEQMMKLGNVQLNYNFITQLYSKQAQLQKLALGTR